MDGDDPTLWYNDTTTPEAAPAAPAAPTQGHWARFAETLNPLNPMRATLKLLDTPQGSKFVEGYGQGTLPGGGSKVAERLAPPPTAAGSTGPSDAPQAPDSPPVFGQAPIVVPRAAGGVGVRPAGWQPGSHTVATQGGMDPAALAPGQYSRDVASGLAMAATDKRLEAAQAQGMADATYAASKVAATDQFETHRQKLMQQRDAYVKSEGAKLQQLAARAQAQVDPDAYWQEKGSFVRALANLAVGINQAAIGFTGRGENIALQRINQEMDRNIAAQQANIANAGRAFDMRSNLYAQNLQAFGDKERALLATKINYLDRVDAMLGQQRALAKSKEADAGALSMQEQIYKQRAEHEDEFAKLTHTKVSEQMSESFRPAQVIGGGAGNIGTKGMEDLYVPGFQGYARTKEEATKLKDHDARTRTINATLDRAQQIISQAKTIDPYSIDGAKKLHALQGELDSLSNEAAVKKTIKEGQGAMSEGDKVVSDATLGILGTKVWDAKMYHPAGRAYLRAEADRADKVMTATKQRALQESRRAAESLGVMPGHEVLVQMPNGSYERRAVMTPSRTPLTSPSIGVDDVTAGPKGRTK